MTTKTLELAISKASALPEAAQEKIDLGAIVSDNQDNSLGYETF